MLGGLGSDLIMEIGEGEIGGLGLSFFEWVFLTELGWELFLEFGQGLSFFGT